MVFRDRHHPHLKRLPQLRQRYLTYLELPLGDWLHGMGIFV